MGSSSSLKTALTLNAVSVVRVLSGVFTDAVSIISTSESSEVRNMRREGLYFLGFGWLDPGSPTEGLWMNQAVIYNRREREMY